MRAGIVTPASALPAPSGLCKARNNLAGSGMGRGLVLMQAEQWYGGSFYAAAAHRISNRSLSYKKISRPIFSALDVWSKCFRGSTEGCAELRPCVICVAVS